MAKKRVASIATIRQNISHLKKQIQRIKNMKLKAPRGDEGEVKVQRRGSQLIINGELYKAGDLEAMKGKSASWQLPVLEKLEQDLAREEYRLTARGKQPRELKALSDLEASQAAAGVKMITSSEQYEFDEIAKIVNMNETAIRVALSRARKKIRETMINTHQYGIR